MEDIVFQIYGTLILALAGFVLPILAIAMSAFPEGVKLLRQTYENEQKQAEGNLEDEIKKQNSKSEINYEVLEKNIKTLKLTRDKARRHLVYLNPQYILSRSVITVSICLVSFLLGILFYNQTLYIPLVLFILSLAFLVWILVIFSNSIGIIIEASAAVQNIRRSTEEKTLELLTALVDNSKNEGDSLFIDPKYIRVFFNNEEVIVEKKYKFSVNNKHTINIELNNSSDFMLKTAELGFVFPTEFLVEGDVISNVYTGDKEKIIRFKYNHLQSHVRQVVGSIDITFLKIGTFKVYTFVKGENLKNKNIKFNIEIIK